MDNPILKYTREIRVILKEHFPDLVVDLIMELNKNYFSEYRRIRIFSGDSLFPNQILFPIVRNKIRKRRQFSHTKRIRKLKKLCW
jgi:hypothetical protein